MRKEGGKGKEYRGGEEREEKVRGWEKKGGRGRNGRGEKGGIEREEGKEGEGR